LLGCYHLVLPRGTLQDEQLVDPTQVFDDNIASSVAIAEAADNIALELTNVVTNS